MTVPFDTYTPQLFPKVSIDVERDNRVPLDPESAKIRAYKAAFGIKDDLVNAPPEEELRNKMSAGYDNLMRQQIASEYDKKHAEQNMSYLTNLASQPTTTPEQLQTAFDTLGAGTKEDPNTIFEKAFAKAYTNYAYKAISDNYSPDTKQSLSDAFKYVQPGTSELITKQQYLKKWAQDIYSESVSNQSWVGYGLDFAKNMFQPYVEYKQRGNVPGVGFFEGPLGYNLKNQGTQVLSLPLNKMIEILKPHIEKLKNDNPQLAVQYLSSLAGMTSEEQVVNNLFTFMMPFDYAGIAGSLKRPPGTGKGVDVVDLMSGKTVSRKDVVKGKTGGLTPDELEGLGIAQTTAKDMVRAASEEPVTPSTVASVTGHTEEAGIKKAAELVDRQLKGEVDPNSEVRAGADLLTSNYRIDKTDISNNVGSRGSDIANRILQAYDRHEASVIDAVANRQTIDKLPGVFQSEEALRSLSRAIKDSAIYRGLASSIGDIEFKHDVISNTYSYNMVLRQTGGLPFTSPGEAQGWARYNKLPQKDITIVPEGLMGYKILLNKPLKETDSVLQKFLIPTGHEVEPEGMLRSWLGWALNPDETLSVAHREARKVAAYGPSWLMEHMEADAKMLRNLARGATQLNPITGAVEKRELSGMRERYREWDRMIRAMRTMPDPMDPSAPPGIWHKSVGDVESYYMTHFNRMPEEAEVQAYFAYKRINEYDRILRDLRYYGNMWREGVQNQKFSFKDKTGAVQELTFRAHEIDHLPRTDGKILVIEDKENIKTWKKYNAARLGAAEKRLQGYMDEGQGKIYQVWNPGEHEFFGHGPVIEDDWIRYVFIKGGAESSNIPFNLLPRRGGGHWDVDHPFYLSQANIYTDSLTSRASSKKGEFDFNAVYAGSRTIMPIQVRAEGQVVANHLNKIRNFLDNNSPNLAESYYNSMAHEIGIPWERIRTWFNPTKDELGRTRRPMLNLKHDIMVRPKDVELIDMDKSLERYYTDKGIKFIDATKTGNPAKQAQVQYTGMRDADELFTVHDRGTKFNPLFEYETATLADPIEVMTRALTKITQSTYLEDYKQYAVSHWLKKASTYLEEGDKDIMGAPYHFFYDPPWKKGTPEEVKRNLLASNMNIRQFLGMANPVDKLVRETEQRLVDQVYTKYGPNAVKLIPDWMMFGINDPVAFVKKVTYHAALGVFSIPQLFVQMQTWALTAALSPRSVMQGTAATLLHNWARINPKMAGALDKYAAKMGWNIGDFEDAFRIGNTTGFFNVQGEHAFIDSVMNGHKLVQGVGRDFLDWGTAPFREGERQVRMSAWYTAFHEFRKANPNGRLTRQDISNILNRADDLYGNMSRASSSQLHSGILSIPTQFLSYQIRLAELFLGSRTSAADKARMFATYATLYGVPMGFGLTGLPLGDYLKRKAIDEGYVVGDNLITSTLMEGIPAVFVALATGGGDIKKGTFYNFGERYAANGMDIFRGDKNMWDIVGGPAFSKMKGVMEGMSPYWQVMMSFMRNDDQIFPTTVQDYLRPFKEISSINNVSQLIATLQTGRVFSKKGVYLDDASPASALFMSLTGLKTQKSIDAQHMNVTLKEREEHKQEYLKEFEMRFKQGMRLAANGQPDEAKDFFVQARVYLDQSGATEDEITSIMAKAARDNESLADSITWQYYIKKVAPKDRPSSYDALSRRLATNK